VTGSGAAGSLTGRPSILRPMPTDLVPLVGRPGWVEARSAQGVQEAHKGPQGVPSLRCEPALTRAIDAMPVPPQMRADAVAIVDEWRAIERGLWPAEYRDEAALAITPEYIMATVRTRRFREEG